jgi:hypothetical protein
MHFRDAHSRGRCTLALKRASRKCMIDAQGYGTQAKRKDKTKPRNPWNPATTDPATANPVPPWAYPAPLVCSGWQNVVDSSTTRRE